MSTDAKKAGRGGGGGKKESILELAKVRIQTAMMCCTLSYLDNNRVHTLSICPHAVSNSLIFAVC
jgi:hypothetical protein